jgi:hypothetical protein
MHCFYHPEKPAVGLCRFCQRGLCVECAAVVEDVLACRARHEDRVRAQERLASRSLLQAARFAAVYWRNAIFYGLTGTVFIAFGLWQLKWLGLQAFVFIMLGGFLLYAAIANYLEGRRYR